VSVSGQSALGAAPPPQPSAASAPRAEERDLVRVLVWDGVVRLTHWTIAVSFLVLALTGVYIGDPYLIVSSSGSGSGGFTMATARAIHYYGAIAFTLAVLSRGIWFFRGPFFARWHQFVPTSKERVVQAFKVLQFYLFLRRTPPIAVGHNPLAGMAYVVVFGLYLVMILTGLGLYAHSAHIDSWAAGLAPLVDLFGGLRDSRYYHHLEMWLLTGFIIHHVTSAFIISTSERTGCIDSIFSGYKWLHKDEIDN